MPIEADEAILKRLENLGGMGKPYVGKLVCVHPPNQETTIALTLPFGKGSESILKLISWLGKSGFTVHKRDESFFISQVDQAYYQLTQKHKEELEVKMKEGLASISRAIADYELVAHDRRKYEEFVRAAEKGDEHTLRSLFIDEVDIHTDIPNHPKALRSIVGRWPTIISDFFELGKKLKPKEEPDPKKIRDLLGISLAEATILATKEKLYRTWKDTFIKEVKGRYKRLLELEKARYKSIAEYRDALKPVIRRLKMYKDIGSEILGENLISPGQAISKQVIVLWAWQDMEAHEIRKKTKEMEGFLVNPLDDFIKRQVILYDKYESDGSAGLRFYYPWIDEEWVKKKFESIKGKLAQDKLYYEFFRIVIERYIVKLPTGAQMEDMAFSVKAYFMSQNSLVAKLLELEAEKEELEKSINELLGVEFLEEKKYKSIDEIYEELVKKWKSEEGKAKEVKNILSKVGEFVKKAKYGIEKFSDMAGFTFLLAKFGPYDAVAKSRLTHHYFKDMGGDYGDIVGFIKSLGNVP